MIDNISRISWDSSTRLRTATATNSLDGRLDICNNTAERAMRPIALGRNNWTFAGSDAGGERAALMYTLFGRLPVDQYLRIIGISDVFAAGDVATLAIDGTHASVMSCQHARPMGRFAGHNVVCDLLGKPMLPLRIDWYVTCLDLGPWGAVYTEGWDRHVTVSGMDAKTIKQTINCVRIYPPRSRNRRAVLDWAAPTVQAPPLGHD
jgi:NADH dehydrogenase FAD-containing subunit